MEEAKKKVSGIEAALAALASVATTNGIEVQVLQDALRKARRAAQESPISVQIAQSESFVERAKKRLEAHDALRAELVAELDAWQARVTRLRAAAEQPVPPGDVDEIVTLRAKLASAEEARDAALQARPVKKFATGCGANAMPGQDLPPMPKTRIPHDLFSWMQQCHQELREALEFGEQSRVLEPTSMLSDAAMLMSELTGTMVP